MKFLKLFKSKFILKNPSNKDILILDYATCYFNKLFLKNQATVLKIRGEEYYLKILIISIFDWIKSQNMTLGQLYIINSIKYINPKFIITFYDYNTFFLSLKKIFPEKKLIFFQSQQRSFITLKNMLAEKNKKKIKKYFVDYIFLWGDYYKKYYSFLCNAKYFTSGSIKNNLFSNKKTVTKKHISFISQFRMHNRKPGFLVDTNENKKKIILRALSKYCKNKKITIYIIAQQSKYDGVQSEKNYYSKLFKESKVKYLSKNNLLSSYTNTEKLNNFITFSSSLGLELISRGKKVAFIKIQKDRFPKSKYKQYLFNLKSDSKNCLTSIEKIKLSRFFNFLTTKNNLTFRKIYNKDFKKYIIYDQKNRNTKNKLREIGLKI